MERPNYIVESNKSRPNATQFLCRRIIFITQYNNTRSTQNKRKYSRHDKYRIQKRKRIRINQHELSFSKLEFKFKSESESTYNFKFASNNSIRRSCIVAFFNNAVINLAVINLADADADISDFAFDFAGNAVTDRNFNTSNVGIVVVRTFSADTYASSAVSS
jgi:hypothetical protein